jgi:hypothetical protein
MNSLSAIKQIFDDRHDFDVEEEKTLKQNWPYIKFFNIPTTWIIIIHDLLISLDAFKIKEIRQDFGHLTIISNNLHKTEQDLINYVEKKIYQLDEDLHAQVGNQNEFNMES